MFKPGQKIVCVYDGPWFAQKNGIMGRINKLLPFTRTYKPGPKKNEVCVIVAIRSNGNLNLSNYENIGWYAPDYFRPLDEITDNFAEEILSTITKQIEKEKQLTEALAQKGYYFKTMEEALLKIISELMQQCIETKTLY